VDRVRPQRAWIAERAARAAPTLPCAHTYFHKQYYI
jgi:hypothetical protein